MTQIIENKYADKPSDWPANAREAHLSNILNAIEKFIKTPNYGNKEVLIALVSQDDLNEQSVVGVHRITEYEVALINEIYQLAHIMMCSDIKVFLYRQIANTARLHKMAYQMAQGHMCTIEIDSYQYLLPPLQLFYQVYANFNLQKTMSFADQLIYEVNIIKQELADEELISLSTMLNSLLLDLSWFSSAKVFSILTFTREELIKIFLLQAELISLTNENPMRRPLYGVLNLTISNWLLKSRNNYNTDYLTKYLSDSINLNEIWMQRIEYLNDKREQVVIKELFETQDWLKYTWAKDIDLRPINNTYVCSFSKANISATMQERYGNNVFGYKSDKIRAALAPIILGNKEMPRLGHVVCYDILYDKNLEREEINLICEVINLFNITTDEKHTFLTSLMKYWTLSFKDSEWEYEKERRYQIYISTNDDYIELAQDERFLKLKSSLFEYPDFISKQHGYRTQIMINRMTKLQALSRNTYIFCEDCLQADFDNVLSTEKELQCSICGSRSVKKTNDVLG